MDTEHPGGAPAQTPEPRDARVPDQVRPLQGTLPEPALDFVRKRLTTNPAVSSAYFFLLATSDAPPGLALGVELAVHEDAWPGACKSIEGSLAGVPRLDRTFRLVPLKGELLKTVRRLGLRVLSRG